MQPQFGNPRTLEQRHRTVWGKGVGTCAGDKHDAPQSGFKYAAGSTHGIGDNGLEVPGGLAIGAALEVNRSLINLNLGKTPPHGYRLESITNARWGGHSRSNEKEHDPPKLVLKYVPNPPVGYNKLSHVVGLALEEMLVINQHLAKLDVGKTVSYTCRQQ